MARLQKLLFVARPSSATVNSLRGCDITRRMQHPVHDEVLFLEEALAAIRTDISPRRATDLPRTSGRETNIRGWIAVAPSNCRHSSNSRTAGLAYQVNVSMPERRKHMLEHDARRLRAGVRDSLANGGDDLPHHLPILHAQIAGKLLLNRELDLRPNQSSTGGEEDTWIILSRLNHRLLAVRSPDPG